MARALPAMEDTTCKRLEKSARLVQAGHLDQALRELSAILQKDPVNRQALSAVANIYSMGGQIAEKNDQCIDAYRMYARAVTFNGELLQCRERLLSLIPRYLQSREIAGQDNVTRSAGRLVLGIGTGRSGSTSFTKLLSLQPGTYASHEHPPHLPWLPDQGRFRFHIRRFRMLLSILTCTADVSHWWLPYLEQLLGEFPDARIVVLKRDRHETIRSFESILGPEGAGQNHWVDHGGIGWQRNRWDSCFPKYPAAGRSEAIGLYWDEYYTKAHKLSEQYPENILVRDTSELDDIEAQEKILFFCGFRNPLTVRDLKLNKGNTVDGVMHY